MRSAAVTSFEVHSASTGKPSPFDGPFLQDPKYKTRQTSTKVENTELTIATNPRHFIAHTQIEADMTNANHREISLFYCLKIQANRNLVSAHYNAAARPVWKIMQLILTGAPSFNSRESYTK